MRRRFRRYPPLAFWICVLIACALAGRYWWSARSGVQVPHAAEGSSLGPGLAPGECEVVRVERADLILVRQLVPVRGRQEVQPLEVPVQLLGVSLLAPSSADDLSDAATRFSTQFLRSGSPRLELDRRRLDSAGHFLAYVYVDDKLLNAELIRAGFAKAEIYPGDNQTLHRNFLKAEREAKRAQRGLWAIYP